MTLTSTHDVELSLRLVSGVDGHRDAQVVVEVRLVVGVEPNREPPATNSDGKRKKKKDHEHRDEEIMCQSQAVTNAKSIIYIQTLFTPDITQG